MIFSSCLSDNDTHLVCDASVLINIIASGEAERILIALPFRILASEQAIREVYSGAADGHSEAQVLRDLVSSDVLEVLPMADQAMDTFSDLVSGSLASSLGDGEAATAALAIAAGYVAGIDEKKATKICGERFPKLKIATSVDLLAHNSALSVLGREGLASATLRSLKLARMQVREHQLTWMVDLIGLERAGECSSLRRLLASRRTQLT